MVTSPRRRLRATTRLLVFGSVPLLLIAVGTVGYRAIEGWSWFDALYTTVTSLTSLGYRPALSMGGRVFTLALALGGIFTVAVAAAEVLGIIMSGELREEWGRRRMERRIERLRGHVVVCGFGRVGRHVCAELRSVGLRFVVIERREVLLAAVRDAGGHPVAGDATEDATLRQAGIEHARALLAVAGSDAENVIITMTARLLRPTVPIIARAEEEVALPKLHRAGATRTVSPAAIIAGRMAAAVLRPAVLDFMDLATSKAMADLQLEEQPVARGSPLDGQTVGGSGLRSRPGLILVAIMRRDGGMSFDPRDDVAVAAGDTLILLRRPAPPAPARARL